MNLFDPEALDRLEGLNERYRALSQRIAELEGRISDAATFDLPPDTEQLGALVNTRHRVKVTKFSEGKEAAVLLRKLLSVLE